MNNEGNKIQFSEPMGMMAITVAVMADVLTGLFILGVGLPAVGIVFFMFGVALHYAAVVLIYFLLWKKFKGVLTKIVVTILFLFPVPTISAGIVIGMLLSNRVIRLIAEQVAIQAIAAATAGAGEALEAGVVAARTAEAGAQAAARAAQAGAQAAGRAASAGEQAALRAGERVSSRIPVQETSPRPLPEPSVPAEGTMVEKTYKLKPKEIAEKAFEKMEEASDDEEETDDGDMAQILDLSQVQALDDEEDADDEERDDSFRMAA